MCGARVYVFLDKAWRVVGYHFRSLDPWLEGVAPNPLSAEAHSEYVKRFKCGAGGAMEAVGATAVGKEAAARGAAAMAAAQEAVQASHLSGSSAGTR